ncbi:phage tail tape measure protein [Campylobacter jejuni]|uniref:phage tail tape measure protein n=1 Tax=Campylobacter jejuni TaxID=197 RepID=UPI000068E9A9|nr:phage tail tape measure protein [Campylobacter jejuni]ATM01543.1 phage tail tape measure protein [Campylobacter jejuni]EAH5841168.1 phage tail tape measure protein [Campylobacter jejuni]EAQ57722.1 tail tape measure protein, TP901 family [Campylobacter jejuni subsp. jejuni CF93-6]EJS7797150.1 phage tail tape measure protein [Campylobacter jejuni]QSY11952.1 phage tail tape measure protein [Campylobacter jejuni]
MENAGSIGIGVILGLAIKNASAVGKVVKDFSNLEKIAAKTKLGISGLQKELDTLKLNANLRAELKAQRKGLQDEFLSLGNVIRGGIIGKGLGEAISFESAMADVRKVVNFDEGDDIKKMSADILKMSQTLPVTANELAAIAAAGGQIGLGSKDVREFTNLVTKMKVAFDMSAEDVGDSVAKIKNILGISLKDMEDLGDSINNLSDNSASKAREIIDVMKRTAAAGKQIGFTKEQIAALSSSFISLGKGPEVAGTAINSLYRVLATADNMGTKTESAFAKLGISGAFLKQASFDDPQKALDMFLQRISKLDQKEQMGVLVDIFGREFADDMATLVGGLDTYKEALKNAGDEAKKGSLQREFDTRAATTENSIILMKNAFNSLAVNLGSVFLPAISWVSAGISYLVNSITYITGLVPGLNGVLGGLIATFLLAKPAVLAYAIAKNYLKDCTILLKSALIKTRIHLLAFRNSCILSNITLKAKTVTTTIYTTSLKALSFVLGGLNKVFKAVANGIRVLSVAMMSNPIGLILGGIAIVAGLIIANWDKVKSWFKSFIEWLKPVWEPIYNVIKAVFDKCALVFTSFKDIIMSVASPLAEFLNSIWQGVGDFFYSIFGSLFDWFASKLSWVGDMISSISGFIKDALDFIGLGDDEEVKISQSEQNKEKVFTTNTYKDELAETKSINHTPSFNNGNINVSVNGTFNIATKDGNFNMQEFANAIQKSVFDALRKQEQNKINTTIYG